MQRHTLEHFHSELEAMGERFVRKHLLANRFTASKAKQARAWIGAKDADAKRRHDRTVRFCQMVACAVGMAGLATVVYINVLR